MKNTAKAMLIASAVGLNSQAQTTTKVDFHQQAITQFVEIGDAKIAYRILGDHPGIPLLLLQHFTGTMDNWDPEVTNGLAKEQKVILFDYKGVSSSTGTTPETIEGISQDVIQMLKKLGLKKVNLLGFSMGGFVAQQVALDEPTLVNKIILAGTTQKGATNLADIVKPLTHIQSISEPAEKMLYLFYSKSETSRALGISSLTRLQKRKVNRDPDASEAAINAELKAILAWSQPDVDSIKRLQSIQQPVMIVNGNNDIMCPTNNSYIMYQNIPNSYLYLYPDANHGSIFQYPDLFVSQANTFLEVYK